MKHFIIASIVTITAASSNAAQLSSTHWNEYQSLAHHIEATISTAPLTELALNSAKLTKISTQLLPVFIAKHTICKEYIQAALAAANSMVDLSLEAIERDYHADGKLPPVKSAACYHAKDLLVHPATMAVIAKTQTDTQETRKQIGHELEEVLEHFNQVKVAAGL